MKVLRCEEQWKRTEDLRPGRSPPPNGVPDPASILIEHSYNGTTQADTTDNCLPNLSSPPCQASHKTVTAQLIKLGKVKYAVLHVKKNPAKTCEFRTIIWYCRNAFWKNCSSVLFNQSALRISCSDKALQVVGSWNHPCWCQAV